jgi:hypothetical protein
METLLSQKKALITWISSLEDLETIKILDGIKRQVTFNFEEEFKKGIPLKEARRMSVEKVRELWKK